MAATRSLERAGEFTVAAAQVVSATSEIAKNHLSSSSAQTMFKTVGSVTEAVTPFLPLVGIVAILTKEIVEAYENVQYNKKTCGALVNRVEAAEGAIKALMRQKEENLQHFQDQDYYNTFGRFVNCLKQIKKLFDDISQLPKFKKYVSSANIRESFEKIIKEFNECSSDLNLAISIATQEQLSKDLNILHEDMDAMNKFLDKIEGGITTTFDNTETIKKQLEITNNEIRIIAENIVEQNKKLLEMNNKIEDKKDHKFASLNIAIDAISLLNKQANEQNSNIVLKAKQINPADLSDPPRYVKPRQGSRVKIQKKLFNALEVACKPISDKVDKIQKHLAILEKLDACPYIIKFHGLSEIADEKIMVFDWAELGTLRNVYESYTIEWKAKISIARDICRGLAFLQSVKILHHDIRCENVLITENLQPKLCNFKFAREFAANTTQIDNINAMIHWLAPEKLNYIQQPEQKPSQKKQEEPRYTIQCEIFSFGMLLWELGFQKIPYEQKSMLEVQKHVLKGGRETLEFGLSPHSIQKEYSEIIKLAWQQEPSLRPGIQLLFNMLQELYEKYVLNEGSPMMRPIKEKERLVVDEDLDNLDISDFVTSNTDSVPQVVIPLVPVKEGLQAHKAGEYEKAWKCFEANANVGDILAIYWQGYYYLEGKHVQKDKLKAMELFRKAADSGNADAQLRYAFCLIDKENKHIDSNKFMRYLQLAADNNNATALYNLGDVYFSGKLGIKKDREKGIHYLRQAAINNQNKAKEILSKNKIDIYS
ncbi:kinase-like domain-containing protein [Glomus cerebriforme]|uniref:Kinase-like domain-containing protein n=1 Tax=Glomus cerebriforme TaxID=658196 RepID=A0A397T9T4_9GLOM|nr:kinase-like domain-containing protein [Glomus cerebriforme]